MNLNAQTLFPFQQPDQAQPYPVLEAMITRVRGSAPTQAGDSMLLLSNGRWQGTVGGGNLEWKLMQAGQMAWWRWQEKAKLAPAKAMKIDHGLGCHSDQCCGGRVEAELVLLGKNLAPLMNDFSQRVYQRDAQGYLQLLGGFTAQQQPLGDVAAWPLDKLAAANDRSWNDEHSTFIRKAKQCQKLWIFGGGHIARALAPLAAALDFQVSVFDGRPQWADPEAFPAEVSVRPNAFPEAIDQADNSTVVLIMTHSHKLDYQLLQHMADWDLGYLGVIGSKTKSARFRHRLDQEGIDDSRIHMPIGLPNMGKQPMAVAVSCIAELLQLREQQEEIA